MSAGPESTSPSLRALSPSLASEERGALLRGEDLREKGNSDGKPSWSSWYRRWGGPGFQNICPMRS
eukprot:1188612-Prorocentrum_minimum.AAC.2